MDTLLLDTVRWDLVLDISGNIAVAAKPYAQAQDAASAIRLFQGELYYDTTKGVPYWSSILAKSPPPMALIKAKHEEAALTVPGVTGSRSFITDFSKRGLSGQVQITNEESQVAIASVVTG
jgi:hypothetical protein